MKFRVAAPFVARPRFEVPGLVIPRKYIDGQWQPGQQFQFNGDVPANPISLFEASYTGGSVIAAAQSSYTHTSVPLGAPDPLRKLIIATSSLDITSTNHEITTLTVAGVGATLVQRFNNSSGANDEENISFWQIDEASLPASTSVANIVTTYPGGNNKSIDGVAVYRLISAAATLHDSSSASSTDDVVAANSTIDVPGPGIILAAASWFNPNGTDTRCAAFAMASHLTAQLGVTVGGTFTESTYNWTGVTQNLTGSRAVTNSGDVHFNAAISWGGA